MLTLSYAQDGLSGPPTRASRQPWVNAAPPGKGVIAGRQAVEIVFPRFTE